MRFCTCGSREGAGAKGSTFLKKCLPLNCWQLHSPIDVSVTHVLHGKHRDLIDRPKIGHQLQIALCNAYGFMSVFFFIRFQRPVNKIANAYN